jgi:salicylate hydroxylase
MTRRSARIPSRPNASGAALPDFVTRALIAGAGIGGLTAALALSRAGFEVTIFERAPALEAFGAGLQLTPNATRILAELDILDAVRALASEPRGLRILGGRDDAELAALDLTASGRRWGAPYLTIHRADLQGVLADTARNRANIDLRLGIELAGVDEHVGGVAVGLQRGPVSHRETGDIVVGADGLRSRVRERLGLGGVDAAPFSGRVAFRAIVPAKDLPARWLAPDVTIRLGPRAHLVQYPLRGAAVINLVAVIESAWRGGNGDHPWDGAPDLPMLERAFADWSHETRALIGAAQAWRAWPLFHRPPIARFARGRVALLGDAAHPMVPFLAQGAAQAIEDAGALARRLGETDNVEAALAGYSRDRVARAGRVQREALAQGRIYHMSGPLGAARDLAMRALGPERLLARYDWLYAAREGDP